MTDQTRGERNSNPGNINYIELHPWDGQVGLEIVPDGETYTPRFGRYDTDENGIRAIGKQLLAYQTMHKCTTVYQIVARWAPGSENNTMAYAQNVAQMLGLKPVDPVDLSNAATLAAFMRAIIKQENGRCIYDALLIASAAKDALA